MVTQKQQPVHFQWYWKRKGSLRLKVKLQTWSSRKESNPSSSLAEKPRYLHTCFDSWAPEDVTGKKGLISWGGGKDNDNHLVSGRRRPLHLVVLIDPDPWTLFQYCGCVSGGHVSMLVLLLLVHSTPLLQVSSCSTVACCVFGKKLQTLLIVTVAD